ncbi:BLUF domain-containing protein [Alphaproteobacteria bacterium]|jgi:hypothetical protein|nr:BLUF domain-containing protein [Alphaproteobacteria bacterium]MDC0644971.1 BLUF domain-containing protein [Alphaproteobacteria bacterium]
MQAASEEEVRQVIYISKPTHFDHLVVDDILTKSRAKNPAAGITGNLIYHADLFLQLLEGPQSAVNELYEKILADNRHADIVKLRDASFNRRLFASWAMKNEGHQSWMLSRNEITRMSSDEALQLFDRLARENDQFLN